MALIREIREIPQVGSRTPWGNAQEATEMAPGIILVDTPSHGGFWLSMKRLQAMPPALRAIGNESKSHEPGWFEEDCEAVAVVHAFPEVFEGRFKDGSILATAAGRLEFLGHWYPDAVAALGRGAAK